MCTMHRRIKRKKKKTENHDKKKHALRWLPRRMHECMEEKRMVINLGMASIVPV